MAESVPDSAQLLDRAQLPPEQQGVLAVLDEFNARYRHDSLAFVQEVLGVEKVDPWQVEVLKAYDAANAGTGKRELSIRSGHGVGKTACLAWIAVHRLLFFFPQKTVVTAATGDQLYDALAKEIKSWLKKLPPELLQLVEIQTETIFLRAAPEDSFISFRTASAEKPEAIAGVHSQGFVLILVDEASGVPEPIFESGAGSMSGHNAITILAGNPVRSSGSFYDSHTKLRSRYATFHVSCLDSPRVSPDYVASIAAKYGERSNAYRVRVLGEFPLADADTVIPFELAEPALRRDVQPMTRVKPVWGLDVARFGQDRTSLCKRRGNVLLGKVESRYAIDTMQTVGWVKLEWDKTPEALRPSEVCVDVIGIGAGVVDRLRELGLPVRGINVAESAAMDDRFVRLRSELWWKVREWLEARDVHLADDEQLMTELIAPKYKLTSAGKVEVEGKADTKKRLGYSPDVADALVLTMASDATVAAGAAKGQSWSQPLPYVALNVI